MNKASQQYVVINGRKVPVGGSMPRSLDGLSRARPTQPPAQAPEKSRPTPASQLAKPRAHKPLPARNMHKKQAPTRRNAARAKTVPVKMPIHADDVDHSKHRVPRSASLTEARAQRSRYYRQHNQVSRYGRKLYEPVFSVEDNEEHPQEDLGVDIPQAVIAAHRRSVNQRIAQHHVRTINQNPTPEPQSPPKVKKSRFRGLFNEQKTMSIVASALSVAILLGYVAYLNAPNLALRIAASRAGVEAQLPKYQPSGFAFNGPVTYSEGEVALSYKSNTDQRAFELIQRNSNWDSQSLLNNYVLDQTNHYETIEEDGLTIYVYNGSEAAWVNHGLLYVIEGESLLDHNQITQLATSL